MSIWSIAIFYYFQLVDRIDRPNAVRDYRRSHLASGVSRIYASSGDYLRENITHGYAVTVHSAQGVTAEANHAVLGENTRHPHHQRTDGLRPHRPSADFACATRQHRRAVTNTGLIPASSGAVSGARDHHEMNEQNVRDVKELTGRGVAAIASPRPDEQPPMTDIGHCDLLEAWQALTRAHTSVDAGSTGRALLASWAESQRRYQSTDHLRDVLSRVDELAAHTTDPDAVRLGSRRGAAGRVVPRRRLSRRPQRAAGRTGRVPHARGAPPLGTTRPGPTSPPNCASTSRANRVDPPYP